ncbi:MAG: DUF2851 family protein [Flavobacteriia bacterium]|nr:DUF2851 family protein [Flavobacteriia bacterium]OIP48005.1 MAG: hypothetical protein AUK46_03065 [Flavobacteriaceae bacterium CG2_30_31_66]PIV96162.1 MAG: DUF2851 domain-containing protein [Flavobacteriaceae bacterium CG17_big_fil_post_rev_8_21_14_2_50_31_13]PIX15590.1 MAG: DUF2851 domain-containing protein [Flavobacteriaceae bacterium CG_4_8_14_3_um_filter_31_8]PIY14379.1 MAG: DUF2851 domain-containing protein [Flavobacteriaceae bacterium CG_4_10_14_3_um_filter_31_253]PIZ10466.1 MAG: DUF2
MNEDFLYYLWQYQLFFKSAIKTTNQQQISILKTGTHNKNSGPDFLNAHIKIDSETWFGNVEMHIKSSDWYVHNHEVDSNYDAVILHVVWEHDVTVFTKENQVLPTLELKNFVDKELISKYNNFLYDSKRWIPCENQLETVEPFLIKNWLERLYFERLEQKSLVIKDILQHTNFDFEAVLFVLLAKNFGLKVNGDAFLKLATSIDYSVVKKVRFDEQQLAALFFGQAGFLEDDLQEQYHIQLKKEYDYLRHKYHLQANHKNYFQFFRMRPPNFPTIRIAQLVSLFHQHQNLFSKVMKLEKKEDFYSLFSVEVQTFWKTHFTFETESKKSSKKITKSFVDLLLINTIIPLKFVYLQEKSGFDEETILKLISQIAPEKNSIIDAFSKLKVAPKSALESQALLTLKNDYCTKKRCLYCAIGNRLLRN